MLRYFSVPLNSKKLHPQSELKLQFPDFVENQKKSVNSFWTDGLVEEFELFSSVAGKKKKLHMIFSGFQCILQKPQFSFEFLLKYQKTYSVSLFVPTQFAWIDSIKKIEPIFGQKIPLYFGEIPVMTERGSFLVNGASRVLVNQILRCPSVYFKAKIDPKNRRTYTASFLSEYGSWLRFETDIKHRVWFRIDKSQRFPIYTLLKALGFPENFLKFQLKNYSFLEPSRQDYLVSITKERLGSSGGQNQPNTRGEPAVDLSISKADPGISKADHNQMKDKRTSIRPAGISQAEELTPDLVLLDTSSADRSPASGSDSFSSREKIRDELRSYSDASSTYPHIRERKRDKRTEFVVENPHEAIQTLWQKLNPGRWNSPQGCYSFLYNKFFHPKRYSIGSAGRARLNRRLGRRESISITTLTPEDILIALDLFLGCHYSEEGLDDIDHLKNRRIRLPGELMQNQFRVGLSRMMQTAHEKLSKLELEFENRTEGGRTAELLEAILKIDRFPIRDVVQTQFFGSAFRELFHTSQLSQYMDETNPLSEITHKRRLSSLGPGGIGRDQAGFAVREIHPSHFGRICPIETPEGQNAGLVGSLASFASLTSEGFIQSPYFAFGNPRPVLTRPSSLERNQQSSESAKLGALLTDDREANWFLFRADVEDEFAISSDVLWRDNSFEEIHQTFISKADEDGAKLSMKNDRKSTMRASLTSESRMSRARQMSSAHSIGSKVERNSNQSGRSVAYLPVRYKQEFLSIPEDHIQFFGVSPIQMISCATSLIPFLEHDDANRALMGSNMQRQAVPCLFPEQALVGTGLEKQTARDSSGLLLAEKCGQIRQASGFSIQIMHEWNFDSRSSAKLTKNHQIITEKRSFSPEQSSSSRSRIERSSYTDRSARSEDGLVVPERAIVDSSSSVQSSESSKYNLRAFSRSNQNTSFVQKPCCIQGEWVEQGDLVADSSATFFGELALGKNLCVAYMPWEGYNFEDAIVINERLVHEDIYTSIHIDRYEIETQETEYGPEIITRSLEFQNDLDESISRALAAEGSSMNESHMRVQQESEERFISKADAALEVIDRAPSARRSQNPKIAHLDFHGVVSPGTWVQEGDILVGRMTPIAPPKPTPEYKLLCAIFETKPRAARETSLRLPHGAQGRVLEVLQSETETGLKIQVFIAHTRRIQIGDKMSGRHGNKGIVSLILPSQDMPFLQDGSVVDILLNPLGVPSRMNVGQVLESLFGLAAKYLKQQYRLLAFDEMYGNEASRGLVYKKLYEASKFTHYSWLFDPNHPGKMLLFDGQTGEAFDQPILVGYSYMFKLIHLVDEKIHARSTGPYSLVTQQPLGGRSKNGGQRLGEMEVWALEGFGAAAILHEFLTLKSDDIDSRNTFLFHVMKRKYFPQERLRTCLPESFRVLVHELQGLCLSVYYNPDFRLSYPAITNEQSSS